MAAGVTGRQVATGAVLTSTAAEQDERDDQYDQDRGDDRRYLRPARCAGA